ncbi:MAG: 3-oxoacyl-ACP synthase III [Nitrospinae bacterium]|nr:3-oxoacyl-ACP synthase III [Nitrospinota bacterium]
MKYQNVCVESIGYFLPDEIVTSSEIEEQLSSVYEKLKLPKGRLELMSGIKERRFFPQDCPSSKVAAEAGKRAIEKSGIDKNNIGCLIHASVCKDFLEPATATVVHPILELPSSTLIFDVSNACLGVLNSMILIANMIESGQIKAGLVVSGENGRQLVESTIQDILNDTTLSRKSIKPYFASLTIGSGAVAVLLTHASISKTNHKFLGGIAHSATQHNNLCTGDNISTSTSMNTNSEELLVRGVELAKKTWNLTKKEMGWNNETVHRFFCHQVGSAHRKLLYETLNLDANKDFSTFEHLGNAGSASLPMTLAMGEEKGVINKGNLIGLLGIGSGINCMMLGVEW